MKIYYLDATKLRIFHWLVFWVPTPPSTGRGRVDVVGRTTGSFRRESAWDGLVVGGLVGGYHPEFGRISGQSRRTAIPPAARPRGSDGERDVIRARRPSRGSACHTRSWTHRGRFFHVAYRNKIQYIKIIIITSKFFSGEYKHVNGR